MNHAPKYLTATEKRFQMLEYFPPEGDALPAPAPLTSIDPHIVRGKFTLRREGDSYTGTLTLHGFHYVITASVAEDVQGKHFRGVAMDDMAKQICEIELADLPIVARDPRNSATQREMLQAISETFDVSNKNT